MTGFVMKARINKESRETLLTLQSRHCTDSLLLFVYFKDVVSFAKRRSDTNENLMHSACD